MIHELLKDKKLVLASSSPRRKEIFHMLGLNPLIMPSAIHEPLDERPPWLIVKNHAQLKALSVAINFDDKSVIVAADTLVYVDKQILGKPESPGEAKHFLTMLSGKSHIVYTAVCILHGNKQAISFARSMVKFKSLSINEIASYINTGEPFDKAGGYGIQGYGCQFVESMHGCYFNVMGFPVNLFYKMIYDMLVG
jgi:septum formation protein